MTLTYDLTTEIGKLRLMIGDTDLTDAKFTDEELQVFIDQASNSLNIAAALALEAWASTYGASAMSEKIGDYSYAQKTVDNMLKMAQRYRDSEAETPYFTWAEMDLSSIGDPEL